MSDHDPFFLVRGDPGGGGSAAAGEVVVESGTPLEIYERLYNYTLAGDHAVSEGERGQLEQARRNYEEWQRQQGIAPVTRAPPLKPKAAASYPPALESVPILDDSPEQQGAPEIPTSPDQEVVQIEAAPTSAEPLVSREAPSYSVDTRVNPLPAEEVATLVTPAPADQADFDALVDRLRKNEPEPGEPHPTLAIPTSRKPATDADPVDLFTGAFTIGAADLIIPTPFIPIILRRFYRSGRTYFGPFGFGWDHSYNVFLRRLKDGSFALWTGQLREERFQAGGSGWESQPGVAARLERRTGPADVYVLTYAGGLQWVFEQPSGWSDTMRVPLVAISDRHGNDVRIDYDSLNRVSAVADRAGRGLFFEYGTCGLLERVRDHSGTRVVTYQHDNEIEHLIRVVLPATAHYPDGLSVAYDYDDYPPHPAMRHNILRVYDAQGQLIVENEFGNPDAGWEFNCVVRQRAGGFEYEFEYQQIQYVWPSPEYADVLSARTLVRAPDGSLHTYTFNYRGDLLDHRFRFNRDGSFRVVARQWQYDAEGNVTAMIGPDGMRSIFTFDSANADPCARRNLLRVELAAPLPSTVPSRTVFQAQYDPHYQLVAETTDEAGGTTKYRYDLDIMPVGATGRLLQVQLPQVLLADGTSQSSALSYEYNSAGQLAAAVTADGVRTELGYIAAGPHAGLVSEIVLDPGGANLVTKFEYDAVGFGAKVTAPGARATGVKYNALGQLEEVRAPTIAGAEGLLRRWFDDSGSVIRVERPAGSLAGFLDGMAIVDAYERDEAGCLHRATLAANTADRREWLQRVDHAGRIVAEWDPNGTHTARVFAENGALLKETAAAGDLAAQETSYSCDRAGRVVRIEDALGAVTRIEYDVWGRLHKITLPSGAMRVLEFGANDTLLEERTEELSGGVMMVRQRRRYEYDRRGRLMFTTVFSFSDDPAAAVPLTTGCIYDRDDRLREVLLPRGARHTYDFDSAGRLGQEIDARGTIRRFGYDGAGDLTQVTLTDQTGGVTRNRSSAFTFDGRGRLAQTDLLGSVERYTYDDRDLLIEQRTSSGFVRQFGFDAHGQIIERIVDPAGLSLRSAFEYDRAGRLRRYTDPMASKTVWDRDALGRPTLVTLPNETSWRYSFDTKNRIVKEQSPGGNVIEHRQTDGGGRSVHVTSLPGPGQHGAAPLDYSFDCLGRLVLAAAGPDQIRRRYDSLDRMIEESTRGKSVSTHYNDAAGWKELVYPDGRHERTEYNAAGQPERIVLTAPGSLGGATGDVLLEIVYSPPGLPSLLKYGNGVEGQIARDDHDRIIRIDYRSGATLLDSARCRYDDRGRNAVVQHLGASSHTLVHRFDASDRLVETRSVSALAPLGDDVSAVAQAADIAAARSAAATAPGAAFILDDADTRRQVVGVNGGADSATYSSSPDHRIVAAGPEIITYNPDGHRTSDSLYKYELDAFGRLVRLRDASTNSMVAELQYDALARVWSGTGDGLSFQRWFAENIPVHEASPTGAERQYSGHPLWPGFFGVIDAAGSACIHHDQGWSTTCVTDAGGTVVERHLYGAFGESAVFEADGMTPLSSPRTEARWRGMAGLGRTTLFVTPYRMYDPRLGVFTGRDPLLYLDGPSPYAFAGHNPVDFADYSGLAKTPLEDAAPRTEQPSMGEFFLDSLANLPGNPLGLLKDARTVREMVKAFKSEKNFLEGAAMALNVVNPLYHAEVARFRSGEAFDRGDKVSATALGVQAALGYVQTLGMAVGAARGLRGLLPGPVTPAAPRAPGLFTRLWHSEEGSWSGLGRSGPASAPPSATRASVPIASLGRVGQITSKQSFRRFVTRTLQDPAHPLHPLLDPATMRLRLSTRPGLTQLEWFEDPRIVEAGHYSSAKGLAGAADRLTIMSAYENRLASAIIEHPSIGGTMSEAGRVIAIGGLPVDLLTAEALMEFGALEVEVFAQAPLVIY